ncbi:MAG: Mut7-C RNAse domain-containing protein, partial [Candidatus Promineifilaceae bacterium]
GLAARAFADTRILLSRDRGLLKRGQVIHGYCLRSTDSREQLAAVMRRYRLSKQVNPWSRCLRCNGELQQVSKAAIMDLLEPKTKRYFSDFHQCTACEQVYWRGSHFSQLQDIIQVVLDQVASST